MYKKILGLKKIEEMGFPYPPYRVIDIPGDISSDKEDYVLKKIREVGIPNMKNDRIGVTIRVSMPGPIDKVSKHGGLHVSGESEVLAKVLERYDHYKPNGKIIVQHTVDARCSGTILKEDAGIVIEAIFGDAPPLLEGEAENYERWSYNPGISKWEKERAFIYNHKEGAVLTQDDIRQLERYAKIIDINTYLEWSMAKNGKLYFYEYSELNTP